MEANHAGVRFIGPPRSYGSTSYDKRYIIIHNTANDATALQEAAYAQRRTDGTSSHYYADNVDLIQSLNTKYGANHVASTTGNRHGISYEITGTNGKSRQWWMDNVAWAKVAQSMALDCQDWDIPVRLLTIAQMRDGKSKGFVTHDMARQAWGGTTHTDPGPNFPLEHLLQLVEGDDMFEQKDRDVLTADTWRTFGMTQMSPVIRYKLPHEAQPREEKNLLAASLLRLEAGLAQVLGKDWVDEPAIVQGVLDGLATKSAEDVAETLRGILPEATLAEVVRILGGSDDS